jgi:molybdate transport system regulatory protein
MPRLRGKVLCKRRVMPRVFVRFRVDLSASCTLWPRKIALLEGIARSGSLSQAARDPNMSHRRVWRLLDSVNTTFRRPVGITATGGKGGGGASVTPFGDELMAAYRALESGIGRRARARFAALACQTAPGRPTPVVMRRLLDSHEAILERSGQSPSRRRPRRQDDGPYRPSKGQFVPAAALRSGCLWTSIYPVNYNVIPGSCDWR